MNINFAFAVNTNSLLEDKHFGEADKYLIFKYKGNQLVFQKEIQNELKEVDSNILKHGFTKRGKAIISLLKNNNVSILVSKQFGENIKLINKHFIPVIVSEEDHEKVRKILLSHMNWIIEELETKTSDFKLFTIKHGIIKSSIDA